MEVRACAVLLLLFFCIRWDWLTARIAVWHVNYIVFRKQSVLTAYAISFWNVLVCTRYLAYLVREQNAFLLKNVPVGIGPKLPVGVNV